MSEFTTDNENTHFPDTSLTPPEQQKREQQLPVEVEPRESHRFRELLSRLNSARQSTRGVLIGAGIGLGATGGEIALLANEPNTEDYRIWVARIILGAAASYAMKPALNKIGDWTRRLSHVPKPPESKEEGKE